MQVEFTKYFLKQLRELRDDTLRKKMSSSIATVENAGGIGEIHNLKKLKGHTSAYRIRLGDYRVGVFIEDDKAIFAAFEHRKDIYSRFP